MFDVKLIISIASLLGAIAAGYMTMRLNAQKTELELLLMTEISNIRVEHEKFSTKKIHEKCNVDINKKFDDLKAVVVEQKETLIRLEVIMEVIKNG